MSLIPRTQLEVVLILCQLKAHICLNITLKFQFQIHYTFEVIVENVPIFGIPNFSYIFCFFLVFLS